MMKNVCFTIFQYKHNYIFLKILYSRKRTMFTNLFALRILINYMLQAHLDFVNYTSCKDFANTKK